MKQDFPHRDLMGLLTDLDEQGVLREVRRLLKNEESPLNILESCRQGLRSVGDNYEQGQYYLSGLMMAGEIMRQVSEMLQEVLEKSFSGKASGRVVLGTVQGDIHDIGKNLVGVIMRCHGLELRDLGVDVSPEDFLRATQEFTPDVIGISGLLTVSYDTMKETVALLRSNPGKDGRSVPIIIGGGMINEKVRAYVGSDYWAPDAVTGAKICQQAAASVRSEGMSDQVSY